MAGILSDCKDNRKQRKMAGILKASVESKTTTYRGRLTGSRHLVRVDIVSVGIAAPAVQLGRTSHLARHHLQFFCFCVYFFGGLECVGHSFAYVAHL